MLPPARLCAFALLAAPFLLAAQSSPEITAINARLDRLEQENRALSEQVRTLETQLAAARAQQPAPQVGQALSPANPAPGKDAAAPADAAPPQATPEERIDILEHRVDEQAQTKVEASQRFPIRLTGMLLFNSFLDSAGNGGVDYPTVAAPSTGNDRAGATMRQTLIGLEFRGPQSILGGTVHGSVYMDFFQGAAPLNEWIRFRTGTIQIDWKTRSIMAGVDKPIFNPREPDSLAQVGVAPLTGAGNLWLWLPQVRFEQDFAFSSSTGLRARVGVIETHEVDPYGPAPANSPVEPVRPGLEGRFEAYHNLDDQRRLEISVGFHTSTTHVSGLSVPSQLVSADWFFNPWKRLEFSGAFFSGQNVASLGTGSINQGYYVVGNYYAEAINTLGGWGQLTIHAAPRFDFHLFSGQQAYEDHELRPGSAGRNFMFGANLYFRIAPNVILGPEISQLRTFYVGQGTLINNHYDLALAYLF
jgi:type II secretory pathway pseudopilin PulG